LIRIFL